MEDPESEPIEADKGMGGAARVLTTQTAPPSEVLD